MCQRSRYGWSIGTPQLEDAKRLVALSDELENADRECILAHRLAAQACSAAGLPKPTYRKYFFGRPHATRGQFKGKRVLVELINSLNRGA